MAVWTPDMDERQEIERMRFARLVVLVLGVEGARDLVLHAAEKHEIVLRATDPDNPALQFLDDHRASQEQDPDDE